MSFDGTSYVSTTLRLQNYVSAYCMGLLPNKKCGLRMRRECRERFPRRRWLTIPIWFTVRAWRTCRDACRDRELAVFLEVGGGENVPGIPGACATRNFTYLVRGSLDNTNIQTQPNTVGNTKMTLKKKLNFGFKACAYMTFYLSLPDVLQFMLSDIREHYPKAWKNLNKCSFEENHMDHKHT